MGGAEGQEIIRVFLSEMRFFGLIGRIIEKHQKVDAFLLTAIVTDVTIVDVTGVTERVLL